MAVNEPRRPDAPLKRTGRHGYLQSYTGEHRAVFRSRRFVKGELVRCRVSEKLRSVFLRKQITAHSNSKMFVQNDRNGQSNRRSAFL